MAKLKQQGFEVGMYTLADIGPNPLTGEMISPKQRMDEIIEAGKLADRAGLDIFGVVSITAWIMRFLRLRSCWLQLPKRPNESA